MYNVENNYEEEYDDSELLHILLDMLENTSATPEDQESRTNSPSKKKTHVRQMRPTTSVKKICGALHLPFDASLQQMKFQMENRCIFNQPISNVAKQFSVSESSLKRLCRKMNIERWPYRKMISKGKQKES
jgi:hypothetical protein